VTEPEKIRALVGYRLEQADEALRAAAGNLDEGLTRSAVNRGYYAMFYGVLALLAIEKKETSRHSAAMALFDQLFVKPGSLPKQLSTWLHEAFALRQQVDYGTESPPDIEEVTELLDEARQFVARVRERVEVLLL
jgi:uncharacterized protein (UPF0332 family)